MFERLYMAASPWVNKALSPFGLMLWGVFESEDDEHGVPVRFYLRSVRLGRVIDLSSLR